MLWAAGLLVSVGVCSSIVIGVSRDIGLIVIVSAGNVALFWLVLARTWGSIVAGACSHIVVGFAFHLDYHSLCSQGHMAVLVPAENANVWWR